MTTPTKTSQLLLLATLSFLLVGCISSTPRYAVRGQVTLDAKPVAKGVISFVPETENGSFSMAPIDNGIFALTQASGLKAGIYYVRITDAMPDLETFEEKRFAGISPISEPEIPVAYGQGNKLRITIDGPISDLLFEMKSDSQ